MMTSRSDSPVLIVGAGPSGLAAAVGLAQRDVAVRIVDRAREGTNTSRAAVVHPATLEGLDRVGVTDALLERALRVPRFHVRDGARHLVDISFADLPTRYPFTAMVPQSDTEAVLRDRLADLGVHVEWDTELDLLAVDPDGVHARLQRADATVDVVSSLVIGADGIRSRTRELLDVDFQGLEYDESFVLADVRMDWPVPRDAVSLTFSDKGLLVVAPLPGDRWRIVATADAPSETPHLAEVAEVVRQRAGAGDVIEVGWSGRFRVSHRLASRYRVDHAFLLGDAAHVHSPAGGQGMNLGIRDALQLAELIASGGDLDRYEALRRPVAQRVIRLTDRMTRAATTSSTAARTGRNLVLGTLGRVPAVRRRMAMELAGLCHG